MAEASLWARKEYMSEEAQTITQVFEEPIQGLPPQPNKDEDPKLIISINAQVIVRPAPNPEPEPWENRRYK